MILRLPSEPSTTRLSGERVGGGFAFFLEGTPVAVQYSHRTATGSFSSNNTVIPTGRRCSLGGRNVYQPRGEIKVFAGSSGREFAKRVCEYIGVSLGKSEVITFSEGNTFVRVGETVRDKDVYLVQSIGLRPNDEFVEILFWMDAFKRASANSVTAIMPYFGYAKGDKKDEPRVSIRARVCADAIEQAGADRVVTMDLHSPQIQGFFKRPVDHLFALPVLCEYIKALNLDNLVVVSPDTGFAKSARKYASTLNVSVAIGDKIRRGHDERRRFSRS